MGTKWFCDTCGAETPFRELLSFGSEWVLRGLIGSHYCSIECMVRVLRKLRIREMSRGQR